ncbi:aminoglycoside phosphotransferase family protein [Halobacillus shinanisalinarum]|uniref:Aminoglycoside phosphotransferase family protein n=1 Tax=Halobacillus shinanisalinarum TaxID=2932258 RepID=A0ABY4GVU4_9BACI|nr:aminoglycoside phosphotransferase family protein [Halobacillus shinanisalinarum]UOQ92091.1 aminoglycoside phosphotransferase family protein [Halobacillus shinanisalinarum]
MRVQENFARNIQSSFKEEGRAWLEQLPELIQYCEEKWKLQIKEPYCLSFNYVAPALRKGGGEVVIKLGVPGKGISNEYEALKHLNGIVPLIDADLDKGVLILEKIEPGNTLSELTNESEICQIAAKVVKKMIVSTPPQTHLPSTLDRETDMKHICKQSLDQLGPFSNATLKRSAKVFAYLNKTMKEPMLVHGDFHHYNVLSNGPDSWVAIDPKGLIGEVEYDLIQFFMNCLPENGAFGVIENRVEQLTQELNLNLQRLLLWGYAHSVLSSAWTVDEKTGNYDKLFSQCPDIFKELYHKRFQQTIDDFLEKAS